MAPGARQRAAYVACLMVAAYALERWPRTTTAVLSGASVAAYVAWGAAPNQKPANIPAPDNAP